MVSNKEIRDAKNYSAIPLSNESVKKKRNNLLKSVVGASVIATGLTMMPQTSFAQVAEQPPAIISEAPATDKAPVAGEQAGEKKEAIAADDSAIAAENNSVQGAPEATAEAPAESATADTKPEISEEQPPAAQKAPEKATEPNYSEEEKNIKDYSDSERYKETDLEPGSTNVDLVVTDEKKEQDGFKFELKNPGKDSPSKTEYGYLITIDKKTGQRTYTKISVTDSGLIKVDPGDKPMMGQGDKITPESPAVTYKPNEDTIIDGNRQQRNLNYEASEETLKHINNKDNDSTSFGFKDNYTQDNPRPQFFGSSFVITYKVNPWPNENDRLEELKLNKNGYDPKSKYYVQGQDIDTKVKVDNIDANAKDRLVGQVYNPITGAVVPGASAYIADDGSIHIKMPEGALKKDENGKTVINEDSIFNTPDYKGIQNLDVKFFARPRTAEEFKRIAEIPDEFGETGTYVGTGAGSGTINHKGTDVTIDKQGIDRYDHYNLIGDFKLNLDDTRYYDQKFQDGNGDDTSKVTSSGVKPDVPFEVKIVEPENPGETDKSAADMNTAQDKGEASGKLIMDFIERENKGKKKEDQWKVALDPKDISKFTITAPKSAKAGDFVAIPIEYTYTNGSKDTHWFHFVVQESTYIKPEYDAQVNYPVKEQTSHATVTEDGKRITPDHYSLPDTLEKDEEGNKLATDDSGNKWTVKVDEKTGQVSAKPVDPTAFNGGEKLTVPVIAHYVDKQKPEEDIQEEVNAYFVIEEKANMTARYNAQAGKAGDKLSSDVILNTEDHYNRRPGSYSLPDGVEDESGNKIFTDRNGTEWTVTEDENGNKTFKNAAGKTWTIYKDENGNNLLVDDKENKWIVSVDENTGKVTATVPEGVSNDKLDGALLNVPIVAHYYEKDEDGKEFEVGTKNTEVQFVATGTELKSPQYNVSIGDGNSEMSTSVVLEKDDKKQSPSSYTIEDETYKDDQGNEWIVSIDPKTGEVKATPKVPGNLKGGEKLQVPVTAHYGEGKTAPTQKTTAEFVVRDKEYASPDYKAKVVKVGETESADVELPADDKLKKPTKYTLDSDTFVDDKGNTWTVTIDETTGQVTAKAPTATAGELLKLDGALLNVPVTAHYEDANGNELTRKTSVQFMGTGTEGTHKVTEKIPFEIEVKKDPTLKKGEWKYAKDEAGNELKGEMGEQEKTLTIVDSKVTETSDPNVTKQPKNAVILIGEEDYTGVVTHTEKIETPFEVEYQYSDELEAGQSKTIQTGEKGSYDLVYSQKIKNGEADGKATTSKENIKEAKKEIIVIGIKPVEKVVEKPFDTIYEYDENMDAGTEEEVTAGKNGSTKITTSYDKENNKLVNKEEKTDPINRVVRIGVKPVVKTEEIPHDTEFEYNPELKAGTKNLVEKGTSGKVTITTTFNKETGKLETTVERTEPKKAKYEYGSKTEGKVIVESDIPYEVEVIEDNTMDAGTHEVVQEGVVGKKETTVIIENSVEKSRKDKTIVEAKNKIIKVGTKPNDKMCPAPEDPGTPGGDTPGGNTPGGNTPGGNTPGGNTPGGNTPGGNTPGGNTPGGDNPGGNTPGGNTPGGNTPGGNTPGGDNPANPNPSTPNNPVNPDKSEGSVPNRASQVDEEDGSRRATPSSFEGGKVSDDAKAPQTFDPGVAAPAGLAGLASGLLVGLERLKRRKRD